LTFLHAAEFSSTFQTIICSLKSRCVPKNCNRGAQKLWSRGCRASTDNCAAQDDAVGRGVTCGRL